MRMSTAATKGLMSSKKGVAEVNNGLPEKMDMELSHRLSRICIERREGTFKVCSRHRGVTGHDMLGESRGSVVPAENLCVIFPAPSLYLTYPLFE